MAKRTSKERDQPVECECEHSENWQNSKPVKRRAVPIGQALANHPVWDLWKTMDEGPEKYKAYLCSREWNQRKEAIKRRSGGSCERCKINAGENVHHVTYARKYAEPLEDLLHLCRGCHEFISGVSDIDPKYVPREFPASILFGKQDWDGSKSEFLLCPLCGYNYSHIRDVFTSMGTDESEARVYRNTEAKEQSTGWRRSGLVVVFDGECGHVWRLVIQQHKGNHFCWSETGRDKEESDFEEANNA